jgi:cobalt-zinc-cadmium efflux system outer membrane protein
MFSPSVEPYPSGLVTAAALLFSCGVLLQSTTSLAQDTEPPVLESDRSITLQQALSEAVANNRDLAAARYELEIARARMTTAAAPPNPELGVGQSTDLAFSNEGEYQLSAGLSLPFPVAGRIKKQKSVAALDLQIAEANLADRQRLLVGEVRQAFYENFLADALLESKGALVQSARDLGEMTQKRFERGEISQVDVATAQLELQRLTAERDRLDLERESARYGLGRLLGRSPSEAVLIQGSWSRREMPEAAEALTNRALADRPDLEAATLEIERAKADQMLARALKWEDWRAGVSYLRQRSAFANAIPNPLRDTDQLFDFGLSIPLPLRDKKLGPLAEATAAEQRARARVEALRFDIAAEIDRARERALAIEHVLGFYDSSVLVTAEKNIDLVQKAYNQGMADFLQVVLAYQQLANQRETYLNTLAQYQRARMELETAVGTGNPEERQ